MNDIEKLMKTAEAAGIPLYGRDFMARTLAILYCYGGGPGGERFRAPLAFAVAKKAGAELDRAVIDKDWEFVGKFREYVRDLRANDAPWLEKTLYRLNIPAKEIIRKECEG